MKDILHAYEHREPEIVFEWKDPETEARGWVVINSLRGSTGTRWSAWRRPWKSSFP